MVIAPNNETNVRNATDLTVTASNQAPGNDSNVKRSVISLDNNQPPAAQIFKLCKEGISTFFKGINQDMQQHAQDINQVTALLQDADSKRIYVQELFTLAISKLDEDLALTVSPFTLEMQETAALKYIKMLHDNLLPDLNVDPRDAFYQNYCVIDTFVTEQYRYKDVVKVESGEIFLDCGAGFGDTALWAYQNGAKQVYCFEPSDTNLPQLKDNLERNHYPSNGLFAYALSDEAKTVEFFTGFGISTCSRIAGDKEHRIYQERQANHTKATNIEMTLTKVPCVKLDDFCQEQAIEPTFIKMDIEGAEYDALRGGQELIKRLKPKLAICLYHSEQDMWRIPLLIKQMVPEYKLYCRKNHVYGEFVLYATI